jgi:hypothetical protein
MGNGNGNGNGNGGGCGCGKKKDNVTTVNKTLAAESIQNVVKKTIEKYYNKNKS